MKLLACMCFIFLFSAQVYAIEPFVAACEDKEAAHSFYTGNGLNILGKKIPDPRYGWTTLSNWWTEDLITWGGGDELLLNYGKIKAKIVSSNKDHLRAIHVDAKNVRVITFDVNLGIVLISLHQHVVVGGSRTVEVRTAVLYCQVNR